MKRRHKHDAGTTDYMPFQVIIYCFSEVSNDFLIKYPVFIRFFHVSAYGPGYRKRPARPEKLTKRVFVAIICK